MNRLTNEQIECIDDLLIMLDVEFLDIRYEMVDHIASALEEKDGDFKQNLKEYFIMNKLRLLEQNKKAKRTAILRAIKLYFKTLVQPWIFILTLLMAVSVYYASFFLEDRDVHFYGMYLFFVLIIPLFWVAKGHKKISVLRPMVMINSFLYSMYQFVIIAAYSIESDHAMAFARRINISLISPLMLVLLISLYRCRKQYVGKYI